MRGARTSEPASHAKRNGGVPRDGAERVELAESVLDSCTEYALVAVDIAGSILLWNQGARRLFGYEASEVIGQSFDSLRIRTDGRGILKDARACVRKHGKWEGSADAQRRDGTCFAAHVVVTPRTCANGAPPGFVLTLRDAGTETGLARELARTKMYNRLLTESAPDAVVIVDAEGMIRVANAESEKLFGYPREQLIGRRVEMLIPARFRDRHTEQRAAFASSPRSRPMRSGLELWGRRQDGVEFPLEISLSPLKTREGILTVAAIRDVTERRRIEQELRAANAQLQADGRAKLLRKVDELQAAERRAAEALTLLETLQSTAPIGFGFVDRGFRVRQMNETLAGILGVPLREQMGRRVPDVVPAMWPQIEPIYRRVLETGEPVPNQRVVRKAADGSDESRVWLANYYPVRIDDELIGIGVVVVDITESQQADEFRSVVLENMAEGLYVLDRKGRLVLINAAASRMLGWSEEELRGKPVHPAFHHQHADGSPYPQEDCQLLEAHAAGQTIRAAEDAFTRKDGTILPVAYSAAPLRSNDVVRGAVVVFRDITTEKAEEARRQRELNALTWVGRVRDALDDDRLVLYAQPIIPLTGGQPRDELLLRMIGRDGEIIPPGSFLPTAEKYGLIGEIDRWVVTEAIRIAAGGRRVQVNLSACSIGDTELLTLVKQELRDTGANPANVIFEITETALMEDMQAGEMFAAGLAGLGCEIALDDFGTGFGSFTYVKRLPINYLKIDIEFIRELIMHPANQHVVRAIVNLAQGFGQRTIAEGIEDAETLDRVRDYGVDFAQGYHIGRPARIDPAPPAHRHAQEGAPPTGPHYAPANPADVTPLPRAAAAALDRKPPPRIQ